MTGVVLDIAPLRTSAVFRRLWWSGALSGLGSQLTLVAVMFQVWQSTHSTVWTGGVGLAQAVPLMSCGLLAGALVDRYDRRTVYLVATAGRGGCSLLLAVQAVLGHPPVLAVLALLAAQSVFGAASGPAARTFVPRLLPIDQRAAGLALNRVTFQATLLVGPAAAGLLLGWFGVGGCYLLDVLSYGCAFAGAVGLPSLRPTGAPQGVGLAGVVEGLGFLVRTPIVRGALLTDLATTVLSFPVSLFPLINAERFGGDPRTLGLFLTAIALGGVAASVLSGSFTRATRPGAVMLGSSAAWGIALAAFALTPGAWAGLAWLAVAGAADTVSVVSRSTILQAHTPDALRGRVASVEQIVGQGGPDLGNLRGGLVADISSGTIALVSGAVLCVAAVAAVGLTTPALRTDALPLATDG